MYFPKEEYERRWQQVYDEMKARGYDAAVIWGRSGGTYEMCGDVLYLSNYYSTTSGQALDWPGSVATAFSALLLAGGEVPELHMDMPDYQMDLLATDRVEGHSNVIQGVSDALKQRQIEGRVAFVGSNLLPVKYARYLEENVPNISWMPEDDLVESVRRIKSPRELDCYRQAGEIVSRALNLLIEGLIGGQTEAEAAAAAGSEVMRAGGRYHMIPCSHGDAIYYFCRSPLTGYSQDSPKPGDLVRGWVYGPIHQGYWIDPGRTAIAGRKGSEAQRMLIERTAGIVERLIEMIRPGVSVLEVARLGERLSQEAGGEKDQAAEMFPLYGHGVGLSWQWPVISVEAGSEEVFKANMVLGVEAFLAASGVGSAGFEQNIIVHEDKNELLITTPMIW